MEELQNSLEKLKIILDEGHEVPNDVLHGLLKLLETKQGSIDGTQISSILGTLHEAIQRGDVRLKAELFHLLAELAKSEEVRLPCIQAGFIRLALNSLDIDDPGVILHAMRALGNICCDNEQAKETLLEQNAAEKIVKKLESFEKTFDEDADNRAEIAACGTVLNISNDNESLTEEAIACGVVPFLLSFAKRSIHSNCALCKMSVSAVSNLIHSEKGRSSFLESGGIEVLTKILKETDDKDLVDTVFEIVTSVLEDDNFKKQMVQAGFVEQALKIVSTCKKQPQDEQSQNTLRSSVDAIVMLLTEDQCMHQMFDAGNGTALKECISWLSSKNAHLEISGALAIGNFGRTDANCVKLVEMGVHDDLLKLLQSVSEREDASKYQQAVFSALRNLAMPAANKPVLISCGLLDVLFSLLTNQSPFVQFKLLGTLRMLTMGQADAVTSICSPEERLQGVVQCAEKSGHEGVKGEATRILALIAKQARDSEIVHSLIDCGAQPPIISMLEAPHPIQQNEALVALAVMVSKADAGFHPKLQAKEIIRKSLNIMKTKDTNPHTCCNAMTVLETFVHVEYFRKDMPIAELSEALDTLSNHENETVKHRALSMLDRMKAGQIVQQK